MVKNSIVGNRTRHLAWLAPALRDGEVTPGIVGRHGNLLVVDDSLDNLRILGELLRVEGYFVRVASDGASALATAIFGPARSYFARSDDAAHGRL